MKLRAFAPGQERDRFCHPVVEGCPLVIVLNATPCPGGVGEEDYYSGYDVLATHLASYGYVVVSLGHRTPECKLSDNTGALVPHVLQWIEEGGLGLHKILSQKVTILGHSIGGRIALQGVAALKKSHAEGQLSDWSFAALVLLAPVVQLTELNDAFLAFSQGGSLLVMTVFMDTDIRTSGIEHKPPPVLRYTGVDVFEGVTGFTGAKHFLEASNGETQNEISSGDTHHFQDKLFCRAYICAFLQAYVRQLLAYKAFFREQVKVPELAPPRTIRHLHAEPPGVEHLLIDIKNSPFVQPVKGVIDWSFEESNAIDDISLSKERVVRVDFDFEQGAMIVLQATSPIGPVRPRLVLRVAQSRYVQSHGFPSRPSVDVAVSLRFFHQGEFQQTVEVRFSEVAGRRLRYPGYRPCMICNHPAGADCARQSLEDIVIPISLFAIPKGAAILAVQYHVIEEKSNERGSVLLGLVRLL